MPNRNQRDNGDQDERDDHDEELEGNLVIPKWFLYVCSFFLAVFNLMFLPWAIWVTVLLFTIDARIEPLNSVLGKLESLNERLYKIEARVSSGKNYRNEATSS